MVSKANKLKPFNRDALFITVYESCRHRPTALEDANMLTRIIISELLEQIKGGVLDRSSIVTTAHNVLKRFDRAAATSYNAYHPD